MNEINILKINILGTKTGLVKYEIIISNTGEARQTDNKQKVLQSFDRNNQIEKRTEFNKKTNKTNEIFQNAAGANPKSVIIDWIISNKPGFAVQNAVCTLEICCGKKIAQGINKTIKAD